MSEIWTSIVSGFGDWKWLDLVNFVLGVVGVWLMARRSLWAFPVGLGAVVAQGVLFWQGKFYADAKLQGFFFICLAYGWWHWIAHKGASAELPITRLSWRTRILGVAATIVVWLGWGAWQKSYTDAPMPYRDTFIASFSILGQIWQVRKNIENWPVWVVANSVAVVSYWKAGWAFTSFLYAIFLGLGVAAWITWQKAMRSQSATSLREEGVQ